MTPIRFHRGRGVRRTPGQMNGLERAYAAEVLEPRQRAGEVVLWYFEALKLRLAPKTFYDTDFFVMLRDMTIEIHEVKGAKKKANGEPGYYAEDDSKVKIKVAADKFPFRFFIVYKARGVWVQDEVGPTTTEEAT